MDSRSESSDSFDSAFNKLVDKLNAAVTGEDLWAETRRKLAPNDTYGPPHLFRFTNGLRFWKSLRKLLICIDRSSNAKEVVQNWDPGFTKIEDAFYEIADNISSLFSANKIISKRSMEVFNVISDAEKKIRSIFKLEIGVALNHLSSSTLEWKWTYPLPANIARCRQMFASMEQILQFILLEYTGNPCVGADLVQKLIDFVGRVTSVMHLLNCAIRELDVPSDFPNDDVIDYFLTHLASVAVRTANQFFFYWINEKLEPSVKIVGLLELQSEIDPRSPHYLELFFKSLRALHNISPGLSISSFSWYIIDPFWDFYSDFTKMLETLMLFVINEETPSHGLAAEIIVMLRLLRLRPWVRCHSFLDLCTMITLLNAEVLIKQQLTHSSTISLKNQVEELNKLLTYLKGFSDQPQQNKSGHGDQTLILLHELARALASLYQSFNEKKISEHMVSISLSELLLKIVFFKAGFSCVKLVKFLDSKESMMGNVKDGIETFTEGLNLFKAFVTGQRRTNITKDVELIFTHIEASARGVIPLCYSLEIEQITAEFTKILILSFCDILYDMTAVKAELRQFCPTIPSSSFPKIGGMGFIDFFLENLKELLKYSPDSVASVKHRLERIGLDLGILRSFFMKPDTEDPDLVHWARRVADVAYEAEYIIDLMEVGIGDHWQHLLWLHDVIEKIKLINAQANNVCKEKSCESQISCQMMARVSKPEIDELVICISDDEEILIDQLTRGTNNRDIVSITGMPGIGKTTLAKKVYNDPKVKFHFNVRSWCSVSHVYDKRELLLDILCDIDSGLAEDIHQMMDEDLELQLYRCLKKKRYLIVLDDLWDTVAWNSLERSFPDDRNGSRVLMTSRLRDVILKAKPNSHPHELRLFSDDESWKLLQMKIFHGGCPEELLEIGKDIAKNCKGLPLAIVAIAGLLEKTDRKQDKWRKIAESLTTQIIDDPQTRCMDILELSYNNLPDHLKACFLYFGAFLVDKDIPVRKLTRLWIAEGLILKTKPRRLEDVAEDNLVDLIGRSLVTGSKKGSDGRFKACRIHDLLRDLCLSKAKEENFLQLITGFDEPYASFSDLDFGADYIDYYPLNPVKYEKHRVCLCLNRKHFVKSSPSGPYTRSLLFLATSDQYPRCPYDISFIPDGFKLLRVLDLESINIGTSFPIGIQFLVQLRYLAVSGDIDFIPPAISKLQKLETLIVKGLKGKVILPDTIWFMERLRHLHVNNHVVFNSDDDKLGSFLQLVNLVSFSSPSLAYGKEKIIRRLPNLLKLRCIFLESWDSFTNYNKFPVLDFLVQLESLKLLYAGRVLNPGELNLPWNLKKLTLLNFRLPWSHIDAIGRLENLEVLKLLHRAFEGERWDMKEGEFLKLKYLKLDNLNIVQWNASSEHLPSLEQLVLQNCKALEEVPHTFGEIPTLLKIEVQFCGQSTEESVRNIREQGIDGLEIIFNQKMHI